MCSSDLSIGVLSLFLCSVPASAAIRYDLDEFIKSSNSGKFSAVNVEGETFLKTSISPDLALGPVDLGLDFNVYFPLGQSNASYPSDLEFITFRHVGYDHNKKHGFRWGKLSNLTFGHGLLMDSFNTASGGSTEFNSKKAGFLGYTQIQDIQIGRAHV